jgi:hypothetical protein
MFPILADFLAEGGMDREGSVHCRPGRYGKESRAGQYGRAQGQEVRSVCGWGGGGGLHLHHNQLITSQQTTSEAAKKGDIYSRPYLH